MIVLDTSAAFAILADETDASRFVNGLVAADAVTMSAGTALELFIVARRKLDSDGPQRLDSLMREFAVGVVAFDDVQLRTARQAYEAFGRGTGHPAHLNFGDCFSYALAKSLDAPLLYKGDDFVHTDIRSAIAA